MSKSVTDPSLKPAYILQFIVLTIVSFGLYAAAPWMIAVAISGPIEWGDFFRTAVPAVEHAVMWNGKLCVPMADMNMFNPASMSNTLAIIDLDTNETQQIRTRIPPGPLTLVADGPVLWCLSGSKVYRVENGAVTETTTGTTLNLQESAFLYNGKLAVIEEVHNLVESTSEFHLLAWTGAGWQDLGHVLLPHAGGGLGAVEEELSPDDMEDEVVGDGMDEETTAALRAFAGPVEIRVLNDNGQIHLFCSDGTNVFYSSRLEVMPDGAASALAPDNVFRLLSGWIHAGAHTEFQVGRDARGVMLVEQDSNFRNGGLSTQITVTRLVDGKWVQDRKWERKGLSIDPQLVSDGTRAWTVSQTLANKLLLSEFTPEGTKDTKLPLMSGATMQRLSNTVQDHSWWAPLPLLLLYSFAASWLMAKYRNNQYEFGNATVELAPFGRRALAKMVDWMLSTVPMIVAQRILIGKQSDVQEWMMDKMMEFNLDMLKQVLFIGLGFVVYCVAWLFVLALMEGLWGISPGKWLFGLRVVRTTLRPCGFFRALVRELLLAIDGLFCMGWLPGAFFVGLTTNWQRLGDLVGDTIVIRKPGTEQMPGDDVAIMEV